jgi:hypothetical protein
MSSVTLLHPEETFTIPTLQAMMKCSLFQNNPTLLLSPYRVQSPVSLSIFREFLSALKGNAINITDTNFRELDRLCKEFGFDEFSRKLSTFCERSADSREQQMINSLSRMRNALLNESFQFVVKGIEIASDFAESLIFPAVREQLSVDGCARKFFVKESEIEAADIRSLQLLVSGESISNVPTLLNCLLGNVNLELLFLDCSKADILKNQSELKKERRIDLKSVDVSILSVEALDSLLLNESVTVESEDSLLWFILNLGSEYRDLVRHIQLEFVSENGLSLLSEHLMIPPESVWEFAAERISYARFLSDSRIISDIPEILAEFRNKQFSLLWRGSRDGFSASEFHRRCDGHANTLTVIFDTKGNIFGGFTPVEWESGKYHYKADDSQKSFLFTLKNPHNIPAKRFALKAKNGQNAILCNPERGPEFGGGCSGCDIAVYGDCNVNTNSFTNIGDAYTNDTGLNREIVFTGSKYFQVEEIEVFEMTA